MEGVGSTAHLSSHCLPYLPQHLIILDVVELLGTDFPLQGVLIELATDVHQQRGRAALHLAAQGDVVHIAGDVDAVAQDHANQDTWGGTQLCETNHSKPRMIPLSTDTASGS